MKKTLPGLGVLVTSALVLTACGGLGTTTTDSAASSTDPVPELAPDQNVSIVFESYNYGMAGAWTDTFNALIDEFTEQNPNITVTAQKPQGNSPNPATDTISSIQSQTVAGTPPDVAQLGFSDLDFTIHQLGAHSLDDLVGKDSVQKNFDGAKYPYAPTARTLGDWEAPPTACPSSSRRPCSITTQHCSSRPVSTRRHHRRRGTRSRPQRPRSRRRPVRAASTSTA